MAGRMPLFTSAPRIVLTFQGARIGFAVGFNINVSVDVEAVYCIGQYNAAYLEPKMVNPVNGTIQILKLNSSDPRGTNVPVGTGFALGHLDPSLVLASSLFDMDVYLKVPKVVSQSLYTSNATTTAEGAPATVQGAEILVQNEAGELVSQNPKVYEQKTSSATKHIVNTKTESMAANNLTVGKTNAPADIKLWMQIKQVRLTSRNANISLGQIVNEPVSFQGLFLTAGAETSKGVFGLDSSIVQGVRS